MSILTNLTASAAAGILPPLDADVQKWIAEIVTEFDGALAQADKDAQAAIAQVNADLTARIAQLQGTRLQGTIAVDLALAPPKN
jgi:hypothetical protein